MKKIAILISLSFYLLFSGFAYAEPPTPITAEDAFDWTQLEPDKVVLVDVRTRAEYFWVGGACRVDEIHLKAKNGKDKEILIPEIGKVLVTQDGRFLEFYVAGNYKKLNTKKVSELIISPIARNIPFNFWDEENAKLYENEKFAEQVNALGDCGFDCEGYQAIIFFCRSGGRSQNCVTETDFDASLFPDGVYEIDQPDGKSGRGGFEGTSYNNIYNGYRGFPGRITDNQDHPSVSWKDTGLPIKTNLVDPDVKWQPPPTPVLE